MKKELLFCPLGGSGEIGMNMNLFGYGEPGNHKWIMVDIGVTFADDTIPGIDLIYPDPGFIVERKDNFIILDFGTATTFDVVEKKYYRGGIIAPGVKISLDTLSDKASLIPQINLKKIRNIVGNNTISAVRSGFFWGYIGLIDNIINLIKKETRKSFKLVITGGYSDLFRKSLKTRVIQNKDITIKGLIKIAKLIK